MAISVAKPCQLYKVVMMQRHTNLLAVLSELVVCMTCSFCYLHTVDVELKMCDACVFATSLGAGRPW